MKMNSDFEMASILDLDQGSVIVYPPANDTFLTILTLTCSTLGVALSALALVLLLLTALLFVEWRQNYKNQLLIQFMIARFLYTGVRYFTDIIRAYELREADVLHRHTIIMILYSEMALVSWMFFFSKHMHGSLVKVFNVPKQCLWKVSLCAWLLPGLVTVLLLYTFSIPVFREIWCYIIYVLAVKWPVLGANAVLLILSLKYILSTNLSSTESNTRIVVVIISLIFVFCFQQVIIDIVLFICLALMSNGGLPLPLSISLIVFNVLMLYQCAFSTLFWLVGNVHTRKLWRTWCRNVFFKNKTVANRDSVK